MVLYGIGGKDGAIWKRREAWCGMLQEEWMTLHGTRGRHGVDCSRKNGWCYMEQEGEMVLYELDGGIVQDGAGWMDVLWNRKEGWWYMNRSMVWYGARRWMVIYGTGERVVGI